MTIQEYFGDWCKVINTSEADRIVRLLKKSKQTVCPQIKDIFKAFTLCSLHDLKVVILGQDPYPNLKKGIPVATGIAFANSKDTREEDYSSSLDILMESVIDFTRPHEIINFDPSLEKWETQGVLLINSALSCKAGNIGSHTLMWRDFIKSFLTNLSTYDGGIVYVLMGNGAQSFEPYINKKFNYVLKVKHPSYYARNKTKMPSDIWNKVNQILIGIYGFGIEWYNEYNHLKENEDKEVFYERN